MSLLLLFRTPPAPPSDTTFDPANRSNWATLSNGDLSVTGVDGLGGECAPALSTTSKSTKFAIEFVDNDSGIGRCGILSAAQSFNPAHRIYGTIGGDLSNLDGTAPTDNLGFGFRFDQTNGFVLAGSNIDMQQDCEVGGFVSSVPGNASVITMLVDPPNGKFYVMLDGVFYANQNPASNYGYDLPGGISEWRFAAGTNASTSTVTVRPNGHTYSHADFDEWDATVVESIYKGAAGQSLRYLGTRTEAQLYLGAGNLWP